MVSCAQSGISESDLGSTARECNHSREIHPFVNSFVNEAYAWRLTGVYTNAEVIMNGDAEENPSDAKAELATFMSSVLYELSAEVEGLDIGNLFTGAMDLLLRSKGEVWVLAHEKPYLLRLAANAYTIAMSELELAGSCPMLQDVFDGASLATVHSMFTEHSRAFYNHAGLLSYSRGDGKGF